jgi:hypothetical protein
VKVTNAMTFMRSSEKLGPCLQRDEAEASQISLVIHLVMSRITVNSSSVFIISLL